MTEDEAREIAEPFHNAPEHLPMIRALQLLRKSETWTVADGARPGIHLVSESERSLYSVVAEGDSEGEVKGQHQAPANRQHDHAH